MNNPEMLVRFKPGKKYPYECWLGGSLIETFVFESTANEMVELHKQTAELFMKNQYEKFVLHKDNPNLGCIHDNN